MPPSVESGTFAADSVTRLLERLAYRVTAAAHTHDEASIHDLRVAIRRFSQSLTLFKDLYGAKERKKIRARLKRLMELTSEVRDCDVAAELLKKSELAGAAALEERLADRRKDTVKLLLPALRGWPARHTTARWRAALTPNGGRHIPLDERVRERLPRIAKKFLKAAEGASSTAELHHARIQGKKLRYSLEIVQAAYDGALDDTVERVKNVQTLLGKAHDADAVRQLVRDLGGDDEVEAWLKKRERKKAREFRDAWDANAEALRGLRKSFRESGKVVRKSAGRATLAKAQRRKEPQGKTA
jgi:CHAD domain-containing protein